jgi:L-threonylcarbamoyladenylate synthase
MIVPASDENIRRAAAILREGGLVAFPTETVYGLGANALSAEAVGKIYKAKGRPGTSPVIVHVDSMEAARKLVSAWPAEAQRLAEAFWPGPLTLVLPKRKIVPDIVSAGTPTVGIRMPAHPVAAALLRETQLPLAAPSANRFTQLSPTLAGHVEQGLAMPDLLVLDGGAAEVGLESSVLALTGAAPVLLRPGGVSQAAIEALIGPVQRKVAAEALHISPGLHPKHYSPRTPLTVLAPGQPPPSGAGRIVVIGQESPEQFAQLLYRRLHELDAEGLDWIAVEAPPADAAWDAVRDRLERASHA